MTPVAKTLARPPETDSVTAQGWAGASRTVFFHMAYDLTQWYSFFFFHLNSMELKSKSKAKLTLDLLSRNILHS